MKKAKFISFLITISTIFTLITGCTNSFVPIENQTTNSLNINSVDTQNNPSTIIDGNLTIYFMDVGQADSSLIVLPNKDTILIDAGNNDDSQMLVNSFKSLGVSKINILVGTHPHEDHIGGLDDIIDNFDIGNVYMPNKYSETKTFQDVLTALKNKNKTITLPKVGDVIYDKNNVKVTILSPENKEYKEMNNYSIVLKIEYNNNSFLFMGDAEKDVEEEILNRNTSVKADVLKVGHHGSNTSSSIDFLKNVNPKYSIIQVGLNNTYGLPKEETLNRLTQLNSTIYRNDLCGTIKLVSDGNNISITTEKDGAIIPTNTVKQDENSTENNHYVYVTPNGKKYHEENCQNLKNQKRKLTIEEAEKEGYEPGKCCH